MTALHCVRCGIEIYDDDWTLCDDCVEAEGNCALLDRLVNEVGLTRFRNNWLAAKARLRRFTHLLWTLRPGHLGETHVEVTDWVTPYGTPTDDWRGNWCVLVRCSCGEVFYDAEVEYARRIKKDLDNDTEL